MSEPRKELAKQVMDEITRDVLGLNNGPPIPANALKVNELLEQHITTAYESLGLEERKGFYKALSRLLHPDVLSMKNAPLYSYLNALELKEVPQKILNKLNESPTKIEDNIDIIELIKSTLLANLNRYPQSFVFLAVIILVGMDVVFLLAVGSVYTASKLVIKITNLLLDGLVALAMGNQYADAQDRYIEQQETLYWNKLQGNAVSDAQKNPNQEIHPETIHAMNQTDYINFHVLREVNQHFNNMPEPSEDEHFEVLGKIQKKHHDLIREAIQFTGLLKLSLLKEALTHAMTKSFSENNKWLALLIRTLQFIAALPLFAASIVIEAVSVILDTVLGTAIFIAIFLNIAILATLNTPFYLYDFVKAKLQNPFENDVEKEPTVNNNYLLITEQEQAPGHFPSPLNTARKLSQPEPAAVPEEEMAPQYR